jgi:hypothetical protein
MILRAMGLGLLLWIATAAAFRFWGQYFFSPDENGRLITLIATPIIGAIVAFILLKLLHEARGDEAEAAVGIAFHGLLLDAFITHQFANVMPNLDPALDSVYGTLALLFGAGIIFTGLLTTQIAPQDERI